MSFFNCKICGAKLNIESNEAVVTCEYCGMTQTLPRMVSDNIANLYSRANHFRLNGDYDKAAGIYDLILNETPEDSEAYWSLLLCKYGIEYVEDAASSKRCITVNRTQYTSVLADQDYKSAVKYADPIQRPVYEKDAQEIDRIQKEILEISKKEAPFDVFICYKETDFNGERTEDSVIANQIYNELTREGYKVFYAKITLSNIYGSSYEPYIFAALNSSKVMITLGTKPEYFDAAWVKNEWSRFLALTKDSDNKKTLIPAYKNMNAYDLPIDFSHLQAIDLSSIGFMVDIVNAVKKLINRQEESKPAEIEKIVTRPVVLQSSSELVDSMVERVLDLISNGEYQKAQPICNQVLKYTPDNAKMYIALLLIDLQLKHEWELIDVNAPGLSDNENFKRAMRFADREYKDILTRYVTENTYNRALRLRNTATDVEDFCEVAMMFEECQGYKDSARLAIEARKAAEDAHIESIYQYARSLEEPADEDYLDLLGAMGEYEKIPSYKDSQMRYEKCKNQYCEIHYDSGVKAQNNKSYESAVFHFEKIVQWSYLDSLDRLEICREKAAKNKKKALRRKRFRRCILMVAIVIGILAVLTVAKYIRDIDVANRNGLNLNLVDNEYYSVTITEDAFGEVVIPETYMGKPVTAIDARAFMENDRITSVVLHDNITCISDEAFSGCTNLKSIILPDGLTSIGSEAFKGCSSLTEIVVPDSVTYIGEGAFKECTSAEEIVLPKSLYSISSSMLSGCSSLKKINLPTTLTVIGNLAFASCTSLSEILIPESVSEIGYRAFVGCTSLAEIVIPKNVQTLGYDAFVDCESLKSIAFLCNQSSVAQGILAGNKIVESLTLSFPIYYLFDTVEYYGSYPANLTYSGNVEDSHTYYIPSTLKTINFIGDEVMSYAFYDLKSVETITLSDNVVSIGDVAFSFCTSLKSIVIPASVTSIGKSVFGLSTALESVEIKCPIEAIPYGTFSGCSSLKAITIPETVTAIGDYAFHGCSSLVSVTVPESVKHVGYKAFANCTSLKNAEFLSNSISTGGEVLSGCQALESITVSVPSYNLFGTTEFAGSYTTEISKTGNYKDEKTYYIPYTLKTVNFIGSEIVDYAFYGFKSVEVITLADNLLTIGAYAFYGCSSLKSAVVPKNVTTIEQFAFASCSSLENIDLKCQIDQISDYTFRGCSALKEISIPNSVVNIGYNAFAGCTALANITFSSSLKNIGNKAFQNCTSLQTITIPEGVTVIGEDCFNGCTNLSEIILPSTLTKVYKGSFNYTAITTLTIPKSVTEIYKGGFTIGCDSLEEIIFESPTGWKYYAGTMWGDVETSFTNPKSNADTFSSETDHIYTKI